MGGEENLSPDRPGSERGGGLALPGPRARARGGRSGRRRRRPRPRVCACPPRMPRRASAPGSARRRPSVPGVPRQGGGPRGQPDRVRRFRLRAASARRPPGAGVAAGGGGGRLSRVPPGCPCDTPRIMSSGRVRAQGVQTGSPRRPFAAAGGAAFLPATGCGLKPSAHDGMGAARASKKSRPGAGFSAPGRLVLPQVAAADCRSDSRGRGEMVEYYSTCSTNGERPAGRQERGDEP